MSKFVEIGGIIKKGLGQQIMKNFSQNKNVFSVVVANGRATDIFDIQQFGDASEAEVLTMIVKENKGDHIFDELHSFLKLSSNNQAVIYKYDTIMKASI